MYDQYCVHVYEPPEGCHLQATPYTPSISHQRTVFENTNDIVAKALLEVIGI